MSYRRGSGSLVLSIQIPSGQQTSSLVCAPPKDDTLKRSEISGRYLRKDSKSWDLITQCP